MKLLQMTALACMGLAFPLSAAAEDVDRRLDAAAAGNVSIENTAGLVTVEGWSRSEVHVTGDLGRDVDELVFERDGNVTKVHVNTRRRSGRAIASDLVIRVPQGSSLRVGGVSIDIEVSGVRGTQRLSTVSGDVESEVFEADIDVETVSGDIDLRGSGKASRAQLNSVSGDIDVRDLAGEIEISSVSGDLEIAGGRWTRVSANTTSGDMDFEGELLANGRVDVETINGDLDIFFKGRLSAEFDIETFNGNVKNCFGPKAERTSQYAPGRELRFTEGDGSSRVTIRTLNGDLVLCKD
ncbi:MAG TPA: DUF4097 family beta strand repeat-containing protein [Woeseiaceae bacterium]